MWSILYEQLTDAQKIELDRRLSGEEGKPVAILPDDVAEAADLGGTPQLPVRKEHIGRQVLTRLGSGILQADGSLLMEGGASMLVLGATHIVVEPA